MKNACNKSETTKPKSKALFISKAFVCLVVIIGIAHISGLCDSIQKVFVMIPRIHCQENLLTINRIARYYINENNDKLPPADKWQDIFINEYKISPKTFICPSTDGEECTYAINSNVAGKDIKEIPSDVVLFFETKSSSKIHGGPELLANRHAYKESNKGSSIVFADGHSEFVETEDFDKLRWNPKQED